MGLKKELSRVAIRNVGMKRDTLRKRLIQLLFSSAMVALLFATCYVWIARYIRERESVRLGLNQQNAVELLETGKIFSGQDVAEYCMLANPTSEIQLGNFTLFHHGNPAPLGSAVSVISNSGILVRARFDSCIGSQKFFDSMSKADAYEFDWQWSIANPPEP